MRLENHHKVVVELRTVLEAGRHIVEVGPDRMADLEVEGLRIVAEDMDFGKVHRTAAAVEADNLAVEDKDYGKELRRVVVEVGDILDCTDPAEGLAAVGILLVARILEEVQERPRNFAEVGILAVGSLEAEEDIAEVGVADTEAVDNPLLIFSIITII